MIEKELRFSKVQHTSQGTAVKQCSACGLEKHVSDFHKRVRSKDGLCSYCKTCAACRGKKYYSENKVKIINRVATYRKTERGSEVRIAADARRYIKHKDRIAAQHRVYLSTSAGRATNQAKEARRRAFKKQCTTCAVGVSATYNECVNLNEQLAAAGFESGKTSKNGSPIFFEVDHIVPLSKGGQHTYSNLQIIPWRINNIKSND